MPKTLLLITDLQIGGTPTVVRDLALHLAKRGHEIEVACLSPLGPVAAQIEAAGVSVTSLDARGALDLRVFRKLIRLIRSRRIDTVLSFLLHANTAGAIASRFCPGVRFLQSIQTTQPTPRWHWFVQRRIHKRADRILVPSQSVADFASARCAIPREKFVVIPNAIDPADFPPSPVPLDPPTPFPLGFIGRLDPIKRIPHLLEALRKLADDGIDAHLHIFGDGAERKTIESTIHRLNMASRVTLHGAVPRPQDALAKIGALVLPSSAEGFGLVLIEAMAAGVPVVATRVPGIRDVVQHESNGLLADPDSAGGLARQIARIINDASLRRRLIDAGTRTVAERYTFDGVLPLYETLLKLPAPAPQGRRQ